MRHYRQSAAPRAGGQVDGTHQPICTPSSQTHSLRLAHLAEVVFEKRGSFLAFLSCTPWEQVSRRALI